MFISDSGVNLPSVRSAVQDEVGARWQASHRLHALAIASAWLLLSTPQIGMAQQEVVPLSNAPAEQQKNGSVETEIIEVQNGVGTPSLIERKAGPFILLIRELGQIAQGESFVLAPSFKEPSAATEPILRLEHKPDNRRRSLAGIVNLPEGEFILQSVKSGKTLCTVRSAKQ